MERFAVSFGLTPTVRTGTQLICRTAGAEPVAHVTDLGDAKFVAVGFRAENVAELERLAAQESAVVETLDWPGGGMVVRLKDPDGHGVEVVAGQAKVEPLTVRGEPVPDLTDFRRSESWYKARFGFITSDEIEMAPGLAIGAFMRCDRGNIPTDHHTLFLLQSPRAPALNHAAFEVAHFDDLMV
eukprot:gene15231-17878_t